MLNDDVVHNGSVTVIFRNTSYTYIRVTFRDSKVPEF